MKIIKLASLKNRKGMTMVNVLAAFAVLLFVLLMFSQAVNLSLNIFRKSEDVRKNTEALFSAYYKDSTFTTQSGDFPSSSDVYIFKDQNGKDIAYKRTAEGSFSPSSEQGITGKVYFFGRREKVAP